MAIVAGMVNVPFVQFHATTIDFLMLYYILACKYWRAKQIVAIVEPM